MSTIVNQVRRGFFLDSVALMRISRAVAAADGVEEAALMMATASNMALMADAGLLAEDVDDAKGGDLIVAIRAVDETAAANAFAQALELLATPKGDAAAALDWQPKTLRAAHASLPDANLALISVPGEFAAAEARKALRRGLHAMIFSDNVSIADERSLKMEARERGLLLMGPDCGTAIINGVPLAFANAVPRGDVGIIGASGTGIQEVSCLIARGGGGVSQAIGVGGRDLSDDVGGITALMALDSLIADEATRHIVLISKPPSAAVVARLTETMASSDKTFTLCLIGGDPVNLPANARQVTTLKQAAGDALGEDRNVTSEVGVLAHRLPAGRAGAKGLFCGGTLAAEAQVIFRAAGEAVVSNAPVPGIPHVDATNTGHALVDLGSDEFTRGRPHPMIDPGVRDAWLSEALADPQLGLVLLDLILGYGADADPAGGIIRCMSAAGEDRALVIASVTGTDRDPQSRAVQVARLQAAGVLVAPSSTDAAELALACLRAGE